MVEIEPKNRFFDFFKEVFCLRLLRPYELRTIFLANENVIEIIVVSFISIAFIVVKLLIFNFLVLIQHPWNGPFPGFLGHLLPQR